MAGNFGKKNVGGAPFGGGPADDDLAQKRAQFLAAERARTPDEFRIEEEVPAGRAGLTQAAMNYQGSARTGSDRQMWMAYLLWFFACVFSAHRFYLGAYKSAGLQLGSLILGGVLVNIAARTDTSIPGAVGAVLLIGSLLWMLADAFLIPGLHRKFSRPDDFTPVFA